MLGRKIILWCKIFVMVLFRETVKSETRSTSEENKKVDGRKGKSEHDKKTRERTRSYSRRRSTSRESRKRIKNRKHLPVKEERCRR